MESVRIVEQKFRRHRDALTDLEIAGRTEAKRLLYHWTRGQKRRHRPVALPDIPCFAEILGR